MGHGSSIDATFGIIIKESNASDKAAKMGLKSIGFGRYVKAGAPGTVVAKSEKGELVSVKPEKDADPRNKARADKPVAQKRRTIKPAAKRGSISPAAARRAVRAVTKKGAVASISPEKADKLREKDKKTVEATLLLTRTEVARLKKAAGSKPARQGVGLGTDVSRSGEAAFVAALQQLKTFRKRQPNESVEQYNQQYLNVLNSKIVPRLQQIAADKDTFLDKGWVEAAALSIPVLLNEIGGADKIDQVAWDTPAGNALANVKGHDTSADMFITTTDGKRWGVSLKKDADVFILNAGLGEAITSMSMDMIDAGVPEKKVRQFAAESSPKVYYEDRAKVLAHQKRLFKTDKISGRAFRSAVSTLRKDPKLQKEYGVNPKRLERIGKDFFDRDWTGDDIKTASRIMEYIKKKAPREDLRNKMQTELNRLRNLDRDATKRILSTLKDDDIKKGFNDIILDGIHFSDALGFGTDKLEKFITIYGMKPDGAVLNTKTVMNLFGENTPEFRKLLKQARRGDKKAQELITDAARKRLVVDHADGARTGYIKVRTPNPSPPPSESILPLFEIGVRTRGIGSAPVLEIHQTPTMTHMLRNGSDISKWPLDAQKNLFNQQMKSLKQRAKGASSTSKREIERETTQLQGLISQVEEQKAARSKMKRSKRKKVGEGAIHGPGEKSGHGVARDGKINQEPDKPTPPSPGQQGGAGGGVAPPQIQPVSGKPNKKEDEFEKDIEQMNDKEPLEPVSPLGAMIAKAFDQPTPDDDVEKPAEKDADMDEALDPWANPMFTTAQFNTLKKEFEKKTGIKDFKSDLKAWKKFLEGKGYRIHEIMGGSAKDVTVYAKDRKTVLGKVGRTTTSIGAAKVGKSRTAQLSRINGKMSWVVKEDYDGEDQVVKTPAGEPIEIKDDEFRKAQKTEPTMVKQMDEPFVVSTKEGDADGKKGDYLAMGVEGEQWPIDQKIFDDTHKFVKEARTDLRTVPNKKYKNGQSVKTDRGRGKVQSAEWDKKKKKWLYRVELNRSAGGAINQHYETDLKEVKGLAAPDFETEVEIDEVEKKSTRRQDILRMHQRQKAQANLRDLENKNSRAALHQRQKAQAKLRGLQDEAKVLTTKWRAAIKAAQRLTGSKKVYALAFVNWKFSGGHKGDRKLPEEKGISSGIAKKIRHAMEMILSKEVHMVDESVESDLKKARESLQMTTTQAMIDDDSLSHAEARRILKQQGLDEAGLKRSTGRQSYGAPGETRSKGKAKKQRAASKKRQRKAGKDMAKESYVSYGSRDFEPAAGAGLGVGVVGDDDVPALTIARAAQAEALTLGEVKQVRPDLYVSKNASGDVRHFSSKKMAQTFGQARGRSTIGEVVSSAWSKGTVSAHSPLTKLVMVSLAGCREEETDDLDEAESSISHGGGQSTGGDRHGTHLSKQELDPEELKLIDGNWMRIMKFADAAYKGKPFPLAQRAIEKFLESIGVDQKHTGKIGEVIAHYYGMDTDPVSMIVPKVVPRITQEPNVKGSGHFFGGHPGPFHPV